MNRLRDPRFAGNSWRSLYTLFPRGKRRGMQAELRLRQAYQAVFFGNPSREDQCIVVADLLSKSGFQRATLAKGATDQELWQAEGKRLLYAETVFAYVNLPEAEQLALEQAARMESAVDQDPQESKT
jgi:hypothetical protein